MFLQHLWPWIFLNQGHQIQYNSLDSNQGYNHADFERPRLKRCLRKSQCVKSGNTSIISWTHGKSKKEWYIHDPLYIINSHTKFWLNRIRTHMFLLKLTLLEYTCGPWKWYWQVKAHWVAPTFKVWHLDTQTAGQRTLIITQTHIFIQASLKCDKQESCHVFSVALRARSSSSSSKFTQNMTAQGELNIYSDKQSL